MTLSFVRKPAFLGSIVTKKGVSVQFCESPDGDVLKVTSDSPRQVIYIPVSMVSKALESQWERDTAERSERYAKQAQQFQNKAFE